LFNRIVLTTKPLTELYYDHETNHTALPSDINVQVQNLIGEVLLETSYTHRSSVNEELNLGGLPNGLYLIRIDTEGGSVNRRMVVAR